MCSFNRYLLNYYSIVCVGLNGVRKKTKSCPPGGYTPGKWFNQVVDDDKLLGLSVPKNSGCRVIRRHSHLTQEVFLLRI